MARQRSTGPMRLAGLSIFSSRTPARVGVLVFRSGVHRDRNVGDEGTCGARADVQPGPSCAGVGGRAPGYSLAGNIGLPLGNAGFANVSLETGWQAPTNRAVQTCRCVGSCRGRWSVAARHGAGVGAARGGWGRQAVRELRGDSGVGAAALPACELCPSPGHRGVLLSSSPYPWRGVPGSVGRRRSVASGGGSAVGRDRHSGRCRVPVGSRGGLSARCGGACRRGSKPGLFHAVLPVPRRFHPAIRRCPP